MPKRFWPVLALLLPAPFLSLPTDAAERPVLVELFTSQGCSSCPPADALLGELAKRADLVALGYHISYWDRLGWKDPLSSEAATARQKAYARRLTGGQVYTPQIVVDGALDAVGSDRGAVAAALRQAAAKTAHAVPVDFAADRRSVTIGNGAGSADVLLARFVRHRTTQVGAGENSGRTADDYNGVETLSALGAWDGGRREFAIEPPEAGHGLAVLVQAADGRMLGAGLVLAGE